MEIRPTKPTHPQQPVNKEGPSRECIETSELADSRAKNTLGKTTWHIAEIKNSYSMAPPSSAKHVEKFIGRHRLPSIPK